MLYQGYAGFLAEREAHGPFRSLRDYCRRIDLKQVKPNPNIEPFTVYSLHLVAAPWPGELLFSTDIRRGIFSELHERFGGALRILISGGAAVDPRVAQGFTELGITFLQGYGLTESSPVITVNLGTTEFATACTILAPSLAIPPRSYWRPTM